MRTIQLLVTISYDDINENFINKPSDADIAAKISDILSSNLPEKVISIVDECHV